MTAIGRFGSHYEGVLARYMLATDDLVREETLFQATEVGKALLVDHPSADQILELHHGVQSRLAGRWQAAEAGEGEREARERLTHGAALPLMLALTLPHELAEQAHHERRWHAEHGKLSALFEQTDDMIVVLDANGAVDKANPALHRSTGWSVGDATRHMAALWAAVAPSLLQGKTTVHLRRDHVRHDGSAFTVEWSISPIVDREGQRLSHVCIGRDITRQRQIEDGLRENDKLRAIATLAAGIAHDFNNLLGSINGLAELCELEAPPGSRQARNLGRIRQAGDKAAGLVRQMLDFSRQTPRAAQERQVSQLLEHAAALLRAALPQQVALVVRVEADATVAVDLVQLEQVLLNLTRNAAHAMRLTGGAVRIVADRADPANAELAAPVSAGAAPRHARLRVIDSGEGIAPALIAKIFEPFFTTKPVGEGTGLGLSAVHGVVSSHGGVVQVASTVGVGTTFSVFLPLVTAALDGQAQVMEAAAEDQARDADEPAAAGPTWPGRSMRSSTPSAPDAKEDMP